jgi:hypothetical protein
VTTISLSGLIGWHSNYVKFLYDLFREDLNGLLCLGEVDLTGIELLSESSQVILITSMLKSRPGRWVAHLRQFSTAAQK